MIQGENVARRNSLGCMLGYGEGHGVNKGCRQGRVTFCGDEMSRDG